MKLPRVILALRSVEWLHKMHLIYWKYIRLPISEFIRIYLGKLYAKRVLRKLRAAARERPLRVAFILTEISKWKYQSLYDILEKSEEYIPYIVTFATERERSTSPAEQAARRKEKVEFFEKRGMRIYNVWDESCGCVSDKSLLNADIVYYQQTWEIAKGLKPWDLAKTKYLFYVHYSLPSAFSLDLHIGMSFHRSLNEYLVTNRGQADLYRAYIKKRFLPYNCKLVPVGHPMVDNFYLYEKKSDAVEDGFVIYAPHWSFVYGDHVPPMRLSTFLENGKFILAYAQQHPEFKWVFKPHPSLRYDLSKSGVMTKEEVDAYYAAWEELGPSCYTSDYVDFFMRSRAMITDCGSFLLEYACTGNPIIRPIYKDLNVSAYPMFEKLYSTYYNTHSNDELKSMLDRVVVEGDDFKGDERRAELMATNLLGNYAAKNILEYMNKIFYANS